MSNQLHCHDTYVLDLRRHLAFEWAVSVFGDAACQPIKTTPLAGHHDQTRFRLSYHCLAKQHGAVTCCRFGRPWKRLVSFQQHQGKTNKFNTRSGRQGRFTMIWVALVNEHVSCLVRLFVCFFRVSCPVPCVSCFFFVCSSLVLSFVLCSVILSSCFCCFLCSLFTCAILQNRHPAEPPLRQSLCSMRKTLCRSYHRFVQTQRDRPHR